MIAEPPGRRAVRKWATQRCRSSGGYSLMSHYTWSRAFNYTNTYYNIDRELAYGPNDNHRRHVFNLNGLWELPFGNGRTYLSDATGVLNALAGGWQVNTVFTWQSGLPFTPSYRDSRTLGACTCAARYPSRSRRD